MEIFRTVVNQNSKKMDDLKQFPPRIPAMHIQKLIHGTEERQWTGPFTFIHAADTQFGLIEKYINKKENPRWDSEIAITRAAIKCINNMNPKPRFMVISGDMLDAHPCGEEEISLRNEQYEDFVKVISELDPEIPLICTCGNHDICDDPTEESYQIYKKQFGPDFFSFWVAGVKFVVINTQYFKRPANLPKKYDRQERFIKKIGDSSAKHIVVFQHIPFFVNNPDEDDVVYLNIEKDVRFKFMEKYNEAGVKYVFCGHYHRNGGGRYKNFEHVITSALGGQFGTDQSGFRICHVTEHGIIHHYIPIIIPEENSNNSINSQLTSSSTGDHTQKYQVENNENKEENKPSISAKISPTVSFLEEEQEQEEKVEDKENKQVTSPISFKAVGTRGIGTLGNSTVFPSNPDQNLENNCNGLNLVTTTGISSSSAASLTQNIRFSFRNIFGVADKNALTKFPES